MSASDFGEVKSYVVKDGFGFVSSKQSPQDVFIHHSDLAKSGLHRLSDGDKIEYEIGAYNGRAKAINIRLATNVLEGLPPFPEHPPGQSYIGNSEGVIDRKSSRPLDHETKLNLSAFHTVQLKATGKLIDDLSSKTNAYYALANSLNDYHDELDKKTEELSFHMLQAIIPELRGWLNQSKERIDDLETPPLEYDQRAPLDAIVSRHDDIMKLSPLADKLFPDRPRPPISKEQASNDLDCSYELANAFKDNPGIATERVIADLGYGRAEVPDIKAQEQINITRHDRLGSIVTTTLGIAVVSSIFGLGAHIGTAIAVGASAGVGLFASKVLEASAGFQEMMNLLVKKNNQLKDRIDTTSIVAQLDRIREFALEYKHIFLTYAGDNPAHAWIKKYIDWISNNNKPE